MLRLKYLCLILGPLQSNLWTVFWHTWIVSIGDKTDKTASPWLRCFRYLLSLRGLIF